MSDLSPILSLPLIQAAQAQKHVTHNEALMRLDVVVQLAVQDRNLTTPPASPVDGQRHIIAMGALAAWAGESGKIALWQDGAWQFIAPAAGWQAWVLAEAVVAVYDGAVWVDGAPPLPDVVAVDRVGISTSSDATNRLAVSSPATLFTHAGAGHQVKLNKAAVGDTASLLFQTGFSGRAELGTMGDDDFALKVSGDGSSFVTALKVDGVTAGVELTAPVTLAGQAVAPVGPADGTVWHDSTLGRMQVRIAGQTRVMDEQADRPCMVPPSGEFMMTTMGSGSTLTVLAGAANRVDIYPFVPGADLVMDALGVNCTTAVAAAQAKLVVYSATAGGLPDALLLETGAIDLSTTGNKTIAVNLTLYRGRTYWLGVRHSATAGLSAWPLQATPDLNGGTSMVTAARKTLRKTMTFGVEATSPWPYSGGDITSAVATAIWLRMA